MTNEIIINSFVWGLKQISGAINNNQNLKHQLIDALRDAIRHTKFHIDNYRNEERDKASIEIANKWGKVAEIVRRYEPNNYELFLNKSEYWVNPERWKEEILDGERRFDFRIRLKEVENYCKFLES